MGEIGNGAAITARSFPPTPWWNVVHSHPGGPSSAGRAVDFASFVMGSSGPPDSQTFCAWLFAEERKAAKMASEKGIAEPQILPMMDWQQAADTLAMLEMQYITHVAFDVRLREDFIAFPIREVLRAIRAGGRRVKTRVS